VEEFFDAEIETAPARRDQHAGFDLQEHALSLYAVCTKPDCPHRRK
jgi:Fur family ferric uptake transcriptional regulator